MELVQTQDDHVSGGVYIAVPQLSTLGARLQTVVLVAFSFSMFPHLPQLHFVVAGGTFL